MGLVTAATLAVGAVGAGIFVALQLPLPWLLGSMLATTVASVAGAPMSIPKLARTSMLLVLGVMLGSRFDPTLVDHLQQWAWTLGILPLYVVVIALSMMWYMHRVAGLDPKTAYFASSPGGLGEMVLLADAYGADARRVSLVHAQRVLLVVTSVPFVAREMELLLPQGAVLVNNQVSLEGAFGLLASGVLGYWLARLIRMPSAALLGPMIASAVVHVTGHVSSQPPDVVVAVAQLVIGASVGSRFSGLGARMVLTTLGHGVVLTVLMLIMSAGFAFVAHLLSGLPLLTILIAYVPGGVAEMALVALALGIDPALVTTHHLVRIFLVVALAPFALRFLFPSEPKPPAVVTPGDLR